MDFLIYTVDRCNLKCKYCNEFGKVKDISYKFEILQNFFNQVEGLGIHFYGGEPLLNIPFIEKLLLSRKPNRASIQTNGLLLNELTPNIQDRIDLVSVSLDGGKQATDEKRGKGVYDKVIENCKTLRRDYKGLLNARMTISPGIDVEKSVMHFLDECEVVFDSVHWQLNALFNKDIWYEDREFVKNWFSEYNAKISKLVDYWVEKVEQGIVLQIIPFVGIMNSILYNKEVQNLRCGAGWDMWAITPAGDIFPCPVMRMYDEYKIGNIREMNPAQIPIRKMLKGPCLDCNYFPMCGGRCLCANLKNNWDDEGFTLVCASIKHLIDELRRVESKVRMAIATNKVTLDEFESFQDYEIIP